VHLHTYQKTGRKYSAWIISNGKKHNLGAYYDAVSAAKAYDEAAKKYHGEYAHLNFKD